MTSQEMRAAQESEATLARELEADTAVSARAERLAATLAEFVLSCTIPAEGTHTTVVCFVAAPGERCRAKICLYSFCAVGYVAPMLVCVWSSLSSFCFACRRASDVGVRLELARNCSPAEFVLLVRLELARICSPAEFVLLRLS